MAHSQSGPSVASAQTSSRVQTPNRPVARGPVARPQVSLLMLLLMMTVFAAMSAGLFYASRVTAIREEVSVLSGGAIDASPTNRTAHLTFILFTLCSPVLLAGLLSTAINVMAWWQSRSEKSTL